MPPWGLRTPQPRGALLQCFGNAGSVAANYACYVGVRSSYNYDATLSRWLLESAPTVEDMYSRLALLLTPTSLCHWTDGVDIEAPPKDTFLNQASVLHVRLV